MRDYKTSVLGFPVAEIVLRALGKRINVHITTPSSSSAVNSVQLGFR